MLKMSKKSDGKNSASLTEPWPPRELMLPDDLEAIERGRPEPQPRQLSLPFGDDRESRVRRLLGTVPGVTTANRLGAKP